MDARPRPRSSEGAASKEAAAGRLPLLLQRAWQRREALHDDPELDAYRILHGFGDGLPGLNVDRYADVAVVTAKRDLDLSAEALVTGLLALHPWRRILRRIVERGHQRPLALRVEGLLGGAESESLVVNENGLRFTVDPASWANTGLFLDARPARVWLRENSRDRRVLNLFSFTGSLGVAAAVGGARDVVHVDTQARSLATARENHRQNDVPLDERAFVVGNAYRHLPRAARAGQRFDGIILDPPPRVPRRRSHERRGQDYANLVRLVAPLLAPEAWLLCFFSRYDRSQDASEAEVREADCRLAPLWRETSGLDFPEDEPDKKLRITAFLRAPGSPDCS